MKNVIEQIRKIKGVVTVDKAGENMAVVVFEPKPKDNGWHVSKIFIDDLKPMSEATAKKLLDVFKPKSLTPEELVDGRIYVDEGTNASPYKAFPRIIRFHKLKSKDSMLLYTQICSDNDYFEDMDNYKCELPIRPATPSEAQSLIRAEIANNYFYELKDAK